MNGYILSNRANIDLDGLMDYTIDHWGVAQAEIYLNNLLLCFKNLAENPD